MDARRLIDAPPQIRRTMLGQPYISDGIIPLLYEDALLLIAALQETLNEYDPAEWDAAVNQILDDLANKRSVTPRIETTRRLNGYVYLIQQIGGTHYKIGLTANPEQRLRLFTVKLPFKITPVCIIQTENMYQLEKELHTKFSDKRVDGEWFALDPADVEYIKGLAE